MLAAYTKIGQWILIAALGGAAGLPTGIPPAAEDPVIARVAPPACGFYASWAAVAKPDPHSKNQIEQLLAEAEVQNFSAQLKSLVRTTSGSADAEGEPVPSNFSEAMFDATEFWMRHASGLFVSEMKVTGENLDLRGGMVVSCGSDLAAAKVMVDTNIRSFFLYFNVESIDSVKIDGQTWYRAKPEPGAPTILVGFKDSYFIVAVGEGSLEGILARMSGQPPEWLVALRTRLPVERPANLVYLDVKRFRQMYPPDATDHFSATTLSLLGLDNAVMAASVTGLEREGTVTRTLLKIDGEPRGLMRLAGAAPLRPSDLASIPEDAMIAATIHFDAQKALGEVFSLAKNGDLKMKSDVVEPLERWSRATGIDLHDGPLSSLGDSWSIYNSPSEGGSIGTGWTVVVPIKDRVKFSIGYNKILSLARKSKGVEGDPFGAEPLDIHHFRFAGCDIHYCKPQSAALALAWCATEREFVFALNPQSVKAYLSHRPSDRTLAAVPEVASELNAKQGPMLVAYSNTPKVFDLVYSCILTAAPSFMPPSDHESDKCDLSVLPSAPSIGRHLRPEVITLRQAKDGIEITRRGTLPTTVFLWPVLVLAELSTIAGF